MRPQKPTSLLLPLLAIFFVGAVLRLAGMRTELWFDEIESIQLVQPLHGVGQVLWGLHTDNKHHMIWIWDWLLGAGRAEWVYRLPPYLAGVAVLPVLFVIVRRNFGRGVGLATTTAAAFTGPLIRYSSEARGYALVVLAGVVAYRLAPGKDQSEKPTRAAAFGAAVVLGFLSHLTFVYVYAGLLIWGIVEAIRRPRWMLLAYHVPPAILVAALWWVDARNLQYGGGPATTTGVTLRQAASDCFGLPTTNAVAIGIGVMVVWMASVGWLLVLRRAGVGQAIFFLVSCLLAPAILTATRHTPFLAVRYFLVVFPIWLMLIAIGVMSRRWLRGIGAALLLAIIVNGFRSSFELYTLGRGHVRSALGYMHRQMPDDQIRFASERPVMDDLVVRYYQSSLSPRDRAIDAVTTGSALPPQWWILDLDDPSLVGPLLLHRRGRTYQLDSVFPAVPGSGLTWDLYRLRL